MCWRWGITGGVCWVMKLKLSVKLSLRKNLPFLSCRVSLLTRQRRKCRHVFLIPAAGLSQSAGSDHFKGSDTVNTRTARWRVFTLQLVSLGVSSVGRWSCVVSLRLQRAAAAPFSDLLHLLFLSWTVRSAAGLAAFDPVLPAHSISEINSDWRCESLLFYV